jgi:hypothetical protein
MHVCRMVLGNENQKLFVPCDVYLHRCALLESTRYGAVQQQPCCRHVLSVKEEREIKQKLSFAPQAFTWYRAVLPPVYLQRR